MSVKILAKSEKQKGTLFEQMIVTLLEKLGYDCLKTNILKSGSEIDIEGRSKITGQPFFCECKATKRKINVPTFLQFIGKFSLEKSKNKNIFGLFFTLSPLTANALENYTDLKKSIFKDRITLYEGRNIFKLLTESKLVVSEDFIEKTIRSVGYAPTDRYLVYTEKGFYWIQIFADDGEPTFFSVFDCNGNFVPKSLGEEIKELDDALSDKKYIGKTVYEKLETHFDLETILARKFDELKKDLFLELDQRLAQQPPTTDLEVAKEKKEIEKPEIFKNPFDFRSAEIATDAQIAILFMIPPGFDKITSRGNIVIEGNRGTGKSMVLRYISIETQIEKMLREQKDGYDLPFLGVYVKSSAAWLTAGRKEGEVSILWIRLFGHLFNMIVLSRILSAVNLSQKREAFKITDEEESKTTRQILSRWKISDAQKEKRSKYPKLSFCFLEELVNLEINNTLRCLNTLELGLDESYFEGSLTNFGFLEEICSVLIDNIQAYEKKQFYILLDEFERYSMSQQKVINEIIIRNRKNVSFKIATTPFGMTFESINHRKLEIGHDFERYNLSSISSRFQEYSAFLEKLGNRLLKYNFGRLDIRTLFPRDESKKYLSGVNTFAVLSSGVVSNFIQICSATFNKAMDESIDVYSGILPKIQDISIREISHNMIDELRTVFPKGTQLHSVISTLASIFREDYLKNRRETLELEILEPYKLNTELREILRTLVQHSYLQVRPTYVPQIKSHVGNVFRLNRLLTPHYKLPYRGRHRFTIPGEIMNLIVAEPFEVIEYLSKAKRIKEPKQEVALTAKRKVSEMRKIDKVMPLTEELFSEDLFICALGFEDRSTGVIRKLDESCRFKNVFLFMPDKTKAWQVESSKIKRLLENSSSDLSLIVTDFDNPLKIRRDLRDACTRKKLALQNKKVAFDVTSFTKKSLLSLLDEIGEHNQIRILYVEPKEYTGSIGEGSVGVSNIETLRGVIDHRKKNLLVLISGAGEANLRSAVFHSIRPDHTILLYGGTPKDKAQFGWIRMSIEENEKLFRDYLTETFFVPTFDHMGMFSKLSQIYDEYSGKYNIILFPSGSKIQLVGLHLFARKHSDVSIVAATPVVYSPHKYTRGVGNIYEILINQSLPGKELLKEIKKPAYEYSIDNLPGRYMNRVFIGGNYDLMPVLNEIAKYVKESSFQPIIAYNFDVPTENIHDFDLLLLHNSKYAIFDVTMPAGELMEIERTRDYHTDVLVVYQVRDSKNTQPPPQVTSMITTMKHISLKGYSTFHELGNIIKEWLMEKKL